MNSLVIPARFCGPTGMGNGGYVCGRLAAYLDGPAEVTLRRPTPLDRPLSVVDAQDRVLLMDGDSVLAEARPASPAVEEAQRASRHQAVTAAGVPSIPNARHPLPQCFVCGPGRGPADGMHIRPPVGLALAERRCWPPPGRLHPTLQSPMGSWPRNSCEPPSTAPAATRSAPTTMRPPSCLAS